MKKANMVPGVFMLLSSCVSAFCLGVMSYTMMTGELPFDLKPLMPAINGKAKDLQDKEKVAKENKEFRSDEEHVTAFYMEIEKERKKLDERKKELIDIKKGIDAQMTSVLSIQDRLRDEVMQLRKKLETIDEREIANIKEQAATLEAIEPKQAGLLIEEWEKDWKNKLASEKTKSNRIAPRVLHYMSTKKRADILNAMTKGNDPIKIDIVTKINNAMIELFPEMKNEEQ